ncbi:phosphoesterase PA-phosphatase [Intrasporangium oryzae NRRL B-24470]|uniref:Phosphoesterase PA-phosphatase n=1 Tax=Intrasporangium oryzae NRRL B-24470 TaxID=1386089 RepID=W9GDI7_9MICO|nr:phosphatase PAP2 family protein [Intrasporangium oryzae]EWT01924.1 phosphoesterase PA-phosphatase [Intrasporangium oryzae NRRL B-24470]
MGVGEAQRARGREPAGVVAFSPRTRRRFLLWGCACIVICLGLSALAARRPDVMAGWDRLLQLGPDRWRGAAPWLESPLVWVSNAFGTAASTIATALVAALLIARKQHRAAVYVVLVIAGTSLVTAVLKRYVDLARPVVVHPIIEYASSAMPSGHASNIAAAVTAACVLSALLVSRRALRRVLVVGVLVALVVGLDRLMLGVHTPTEVVAGYALGVGMGLFTAFFVNPTMRRRN